MTTMIERVARVICGEPPDRVGPFTCDDGRAVDPGKPAWTAWEREARAAIEAMREPTEAMVYGGDNTPTGHSWGAGGEFAACEPIWRAMIDEALK